MLAAAAAWSALVWTGMIRAQPKKPLVVVGWVEGGSSAANGHRLASMKEGLAALGWNEGVNYVLEARWADGVTERAPALVAEIIAKKPSVIVTSPSNVTAAVAKVAPGIPIVQANGGSLILSGLAKSLARPGGMVTGLMSITETLSEKYLEMLLLAVPTMRRVGFLLDAGHWNRVENLKVAQRMTMHHKVEARFVELTNAAELERAFANLNNEKIEGLVLMPAAWFTAERRRIMSLALKYRLPTISGNNEFAPEGALLTYGNDRHVNFRRSAHYVDKILRGAKPADLPIEQAMRIELVLNHRTAKALGLKLPPELVVRADKVIE